ncbi:MAG: glutamate-5-semialdehyde dehydrogenase [Clostridia bacterium]|nr:glutamate-5-semialdehyde dehydrogenase [Clostridia bacterium]
MKTTMQIMQDARRAAPMLACADTETKNRALYAMADALVGAADAILAANREDMEAARGRISDVMLDRLALTEARIGSMAQGIRDVAALADPCGQVLAEHTRADGLQIRKTAVPLGVIAIIYESRPNVTSDAAALCVKSGNGCILRSGKDAWKSAYAITCALQKGLEAAGLDPLLVQLVEDVTRESSYDLMRGVGYIDLLIPRGGAGLIRACVDNAKVPCIETGTGICHIYIDGAADPAKAVSILTNAKTSRPSVCNAAEVCLVDEKIAPVVLPMVKKALAEDRIAEGKSPVELRLDEKAAAIIDGTPAGEADFDTEFLDYILGVKVVAGVEEAVAHIAAHSTHHSEAIVTEDPAAAALFTARVDSAAVYVNASTRFTDGGEFGLGCEMGISTQKLHARGPMGLAELCTYKYVITGDGHVR